MDTVESTPSEPTATPEPATTLTDQLPGAPAPEATPDPAQQVADPAAPADPNDTSTSELRAPTEYESFTLPEGWDVAEEDMAAFSEIAREIDVDQAGAQKLVELFTTIEQARVEALPEQLKELQAQESEARVNGWVEELRQDAEYEKKAASVKAFEDSGLLKKIPGLSDHLTTDNNLLNPAVFNLVAWIGSQLSEDGGAAIINGGPGDGKTPAQGMFTNSGHV